MAAFFMMLIPPGSVIELEFVAVPRSFPLSLDGESRVAWPLAPRDSQR